MHAILHDFFIDAKPSVIFDHFTLPKHLNNWWTLRSTGTPLLDEQYNFYFSDIYNWYGEVDEVTREKSFYIRMTDTGDYQDWKNTRFGFQLQQLEHTTQLSFKHDQWLSTNHEFRKTSFCWAILLQGLKRYIESGNITPFNQRS